MSVGKFQLTKKTFLIIALIGLLILGFIWLGVTQQSPTRKNAAGTVTVSILNGIGIQDIYVLNQNTMQHYYATRITLPYSFNCTEGDALQITVSTTSGYAWNAWTFYPMGITMSDNTADFIAGSTNYFGDIVYHDRIIMVPNCRALPQPQPTLFINPTPTPVE